MIGSIFNSIRHQELRHVAPQLLMAAEQMAEQDRQRANRLTDCLCSMGIDPDDA
ncbi:hypothetical protein [Pseudanabaena sp. SR411]|uniref:hypothetical protein n=1 Tax=Pseudanabaena sp. SR411 TaxID=1980935 RepID=UPI001595847C|nr:hypothetical protein [Pseudanabaena sp. SR411]